MLGNVVAPQKFIIKKFIEIYSCLSHSAKSIVKNKNTKNTNSASLGANR